MNAGANLRDVWFYRDSKKREIVLVIQVGLPGGLGGMAVPVWASKIPHAPMTFQRRGAGERLAVIRGQCIPGQAAPRVFSARAFA